MKLYLPESEELVTDSEKLSELTKSSIKFFYLLVGEQFSPFRHF